jgi:uncharacterized protein DUF6353
MTFADIAKRATRFASDHSPAILTGIAVAGTVTTAYLTGKAAFKAAQIIDEREVSPVGGIRDEIDIRDKVDLTWKLFIPAAGMAGMTIACIIMSNRVGSRRAAALAGAYAVTERAFEEYKEKVTEKIGVNKERAVRDEIAQDHVTRDQPNKEVIVLSGDVLFRDDWSGRYFRSTMEDVKAAQNKVNHQRLNDNYASVNDFYCAVGLPTTRAGDESGWNLDRGLELAFSTAVTENQEPCIVVSFNVEPIREYYRVN